MKVLLCDKVSQVCGDILKRNGLEIVYSETNEMLMQNIEVRTIFFFLKKKN